MIIKSFTAESAASALKEVRSQMGGEAVVLKTRKVVDESGRAAIEVTACLDRSSVAQSSRILSSRSNRVADAIRASESSEQAVVPAAEPKQTPAPVEASPAEPQVDKRLAELEAKLAQLIESSSKTTVTQVTAMLDGFTKAAQQQGASEELVRLQMLLADGDVPETFSAAFLATLMPDPDSDETLTESARRALTNSLADIMEPSVTLDPGDTLIVFGPSGAGKTSMIGKLAAHLVGVEKKKVRLVSLDDVKIGAHDEIVSYAALLGVELTEPTGSNEKLSRYADSVTLIDTPGLPGDDKSFAQFAERVSKVGASHRVAVFSSLTRSSDVADIAERIRVMQPTHVAMSMLDVTSRHGALIAACEATGAKLAWLAKSPAGVGTVHAPDPARLATTLIPAEVSHE